MTDIGLGISVFVFGVGIALSEWGAATKNKEILILAGFTFFIGGLNVAFGI